MGTARPDQRARLAGRQLEALTRRVEGGSFADIAKGMRKLYRGYTEAQAAADVQAALRATLALLSGDDATDLQRVLELERLDRYMRKAEEALADSETPLDKLRAVDRLVRIGRRRDALLALDVSAEVPPSPEADEVDELRRRREERMQRAAK